MAKIDFKKSISESVVNFARGLYGTIDLKGTEKMIKKNIDRGMPEQLAKSVVERSLKSTAGQAGAQITETVPFRGISNSIKNYNTSKYNYVNKLSDEKHSMLKSIKEAHKDAGGYNYGTIAGTAVTLGVAGRIVSGGGLYKDKYGNTNIAGIPFV